MSSLLYISIAYYMQEAGGGGGVQKACKIAYTLNGRPLSNIEAHIIISFQPKKAAIFNFNILGLSNDLLRLLPIQT